MTKFTIDTKIMNSATSGQVVFRDSNTLGYLFINTGNSPVLINNYSLLPSASLKTFEPNMIDATSYRINFNQYTACASIYAELTVLIYNKG